MNFKDTELSAQDGSPILMFEFTTGADIVRYTNAAESVYYLGDWQAEPITVSAVTQTGDVTKDTIRVSFAKSNAFASSFISSPVSAITTLSIYRAHGHGGISNPIVYWKGRVASATMQSGAIGLECESIFSSLRRYGLKTRFQKTCRHALYGKGCNLNPQNFVYTIVCSEVIGPFEFGYFVQAPHPPLPENHLNGGMIQIPDGSLRYVTQQNSSTIVLASSAVPLTSAIHLDGQAIVKVFPGCDRTIQACKKKFNNVRNFGGFPWIPERNPFTNSLKRA